MTTDFLILQRIAFDVVYGVLIGLLLGGVSLALKGRQNNKNLNL